MQFVRMLGIMGFVAALGLGVGCTREAEYQPSEADTTALSQSVAAGVKEAISPLVTAVGEVKTGVDDIKTTVATHGQDITVIKTDIGEIKDRLNTCLNCPQPGAKPAAAPARPPVQRRTIQKPPAKVAPAPAPAVATPPPAPPAPVVVAAAPPACACPLPSASTTPSGPPPGTSNAAEFQARERERIQQEFDRERETERRLFQAEKTRLETELETAKKRCGGKPCR